MGKTRTIVLIVVVVTLTLAVQALFGGWISARLSTWPPLRRFNLFSPQAPIVITNKEVVRVSDTQDTVDAVNRIKSRLATVVMLQNNRLVAAGTAINVTGDGYFATVQTTFTTKGVPYFVVLNDGRSLPISGLHPDSQTNLMIFRADGHDVPVAPFADSKGLLPGQKIVFASGTLGSFTLGFKESYVSGRQTDSSGRIFNSDQPSRTFGAQSVVSTLPGDVVVTLDGEVAGLWDGSTVLSSNVIKNSIDNFFSNNNVFRRPLYGFTYRMISSAESGVLNVPQGALVAKPDPTTPAITAGSAAAAAGLQEGDYIVKINDTTVNEENQLEEVLSRFKPGDLIAFTIVRDKQTLILNITAAQPK